MRNSLVMNLVAVTVTLILVSLQQVNSCSVPEGWKPPTTVELMKWPQRLIRARVIRKVPGPYYPSTIYTAEVEVQCILRGERVPVKFNVTGAGYYPGLCYATILEEEKQYIIGLNDNGSADPPAIKEEAFDEALQACNLNPPTYPIGLTEDTAEVICPAGLPDGSCKEH